jgi:pimeloyl-ACP methyl ester carboxylesterase
MAQYVDVNGVRTWYEERGDGEPLVLLHGGFSDSRDFARNLGGLADRFRPFLPERRETLRRRRQTFEAELRA